jgi:hypothetical protein
MRKLLVVILILLGTSVVFAQSAKLKGRVLDPSGATIPGVQVTLHQADTIVAQGVTSSTGDFEIGVAPGEYQVEISAPGFQSRRAVTLTANLGPLTVTMKLAQITETVNVTDVSNQVSVEPDSSLSTTVLDKDFVRAISMKTPLFCSGMLLLTLGILLQRSSLRTNSVTSIRV